MAKRQSPIQTFMKYAGSMQGPADLSSRRGYSRGAEKKAETELSAAEAESAAKARRKNTQPAASQH
jgi:hypothetical protein